jgi:hypothetical protein
MKNEIEVASKALCAAIGAVAIQRRPTSGNVRVVPGGVEIDAQGETYRFSRLPDGVVRMNPAIVEAGSRFDPEAFFAVCDVLREEAQGVTAQPGMPHYLTTDDGIPGRSTKAVLEMMAQERVVEALQISATLAVHPSATAVAAWQDGAHGFRAVETSHGNDRFIVCVSKSSNGKPSSARVVPVRNDDHRTSLIDGLSRREIPAEGLAAAFYPKTVRQGGLEDAFILEGIRDAARAGLRDVIQQPAPSLPLAPRRGMKP